LAREKGFKVVIKQTATSIWNIALNYLEINCRFGFEEKSQVKAIESLHAS
jgi:hypothetical protein